MEFPPILVINLAHRSDRWAQIQEDFLSWGIPLERVEAVKDSPGWKGCWKSHKKCIQLAKDRGYPWVLVLEDDCYPEGEGRQKFLELLPILWDDRKQFDIFLGGTGWIEEPKLLRNDPPIFSVKSTLTHFTLVTEDAYDRILDMEMSEPIDEFYKKYMRTWCTVPHIANQRPGENDIDGNILNKNPLLDASYSKLNEMLKKEGYTSYSKYAATVHSNSVLQDIVMKSKLKKKMKEFINSLGVIVVLSIAWYFVRK